jgi:hypothetical protein
MKRIIYTMAFVLLFTSSCNLLRRTEFQHGMTESKFLRQNRGAVMSSLDGQNMKTYRINRGDRFYVLATFENGVLVNLEEKELTPNWMENPNNTSNPRKN